MKNFSLDGWRQLHIRIMQAIEAKVALGEIERIIERACPELTPDRSMPPNIYYRGHIQGLPSPEIEIALIPKKTGLQVKGVWDYGSYSPCR